MSVSAPARPGSERLLDRLRVDGFAFLPAAQLRAELEADGGLPDWAMFTRSWDRLEPDAHLAALGRQRQRRYGVYSLGRSGVAVRHAHEPHHQALAYNGLQGGIDRWFAPIERATSDSASLQTLLRYARDRFGDVAPSISHWRVEAHQFRIETGPGRVGEPTPEGVHRDGVDFVFVVLIDRRNIADGVTSIHAPGAGELGRFTLESPGDAVLLDDRRVLHGVTPVSVNDGAAAAHRDVLVLTYRASHPG